MILRTMLQRLYASLISGPGLNARPHNSRQRIDVLELQHLQGTDPATILTQLLTHPERKLDFPGKVPNFQRPQYPPSEWSDEQRRAERASDQQARVLNKLRDITEDATDYYNDYGEHALYLGFPLFSLPPTDERQGFRSNRVLAPVALVPINLSVRRGAGAGVTLEVVGSGADLVQPNPALMAWLEQQTGVSTETLFADDAGEDPWREIAAVLALLKKATGMGEEIAFDAGTKLAPVPRTDNLSAKPTLIPGAILGLFPMANPGLLRDTRWMTENEATLKNPLPPFLSPQALAEAEVNTIPEAKEFDHAAGAAKAARDFAAELLVTHADPCQAEAVRHARASAALVIHGPPGTGKSQTIANIIGDHLARGERVLFVCDKRTALDVVKYRLDSMGLGSLCGVIHDPQRDRSAFYLGLRERLENLAQDATLADPTRDLDLINQRLNALHAELRGNFDRLHATGGGAESFHQLCGEWLGLRTLGGVDLPETDGLTMDLLKAHRADGEEVSTRGLKARWPENPFRDRLGMTVSQWLATTPADIRQALERVRQAAREADQHAGPGLLPLDPHLPALEQAAARSALADRLTDAAQRGLVDVAAKLAGDAGGKRWHGELGALAHEGALLNQPLDRELYLQVKGAVPPLGDCNRQLLALNEWNAIAASWTRFFAFGKKKRAALALAPLALGFTPESLARAHTFYTALKARHLWTDLRDRVLGIESANLPADDVLTALRDGLPEVLAVLETADHPANALVRSPALTALKDLAAQAGALIDNLRRSAKRATAIHRLEQSLASSALFTSPAIGGLSAGWRANGPAEPGCQAFIDHADTLDDAVRLIDRLHTLPPPLQTAYSDAAARGLPWIDAEPALRAAALAREIRRRLREDDGLARIDTQRVDAAFSELLHRTGEKTELVRRKILHRWQGRWRERLLAATGSRLNSLGAALRQRLFVRGQKAMKLRQMIAAGADSEGGDPLFELCPVWMAGPATVAQIFPREALFDVIVFDEASQCRLEEALPVLLRGRRVVIAGDPKQLPPTRFFEQSLAESDDTAAETAEEVFVQQQSEAEDLLTAALNLNVQEAFLDVHYRSRNEALIGFSNDAFYGGRLQPIPGHPRNRAFEAPIKLVRVDGEYRDRGNEAEAKAAANLVAELLDEKEPPSIGLACFNLNQRDLILDALEEKAAQDRTFADRLEIARHRRGRDSFEGLFVKNLENVQGDERDHIIISTTFGTDAKGKFRRNFGALSRAGGERRLNVLVTRARSMIHVLTSIPRPEYASPEPLADGQRPTGRHQLYAYLRYAEGLQARFEEWQTDIETAQRNAAATCQAQPTRHASKVAEALGQHLLDGHNIGSTIYWGNDGFCVDVALANPALPADVTIGVLADFTRYLKTPDPIAWEHFRSQVLTSQGWHLHRIWTPSLFRDPEGNVGVICKKHLETAAGTKEKPNDKTSDQSPV
jgi:hypothetical protein